MSVLKQRLHRKNEAGEYDVVRLETSSDLVIRPDGTSVEQSLASISQQLGNVSTPTAADIGALPLSGGTMTGAIRYSTSSGWSGNVIDVRDGGANHGAGLLLGAGGETIIGSGESHSALFTALGDAGSTEEMHIASDNSISLHTNCQTVANRKTVIINTAGKVTAPGGFGGNADTATKLATARTVRTNLASTATASFDGSGNITPGVTGTLPVGNGGTGVTSIAALKSALGGYSIKCGEMYVKSGGYFNIGVTAIFCIVVAYNGLSGVYEAAIATQSKTGSIVNTSGTVTGTMNKQFYLSGNYIYHSGESVNRPSIAPFAGAYMSFDYIAFY